ncbi:MAG: alpha/beta hydrolase [Ferruginibacter sp.]
MLIFSSCAFRSIKRYKGIEFYKADSAKHIASQKLNVFSPKRKSATKNVLIFIHGGNWNSGKRSLYNFFGTRMARKGITTVVIDYPLSPKANYKEMALVSAAAAKWAKENIASYGGAPERIFMSGHSAGGHLAALVSLDDEYFDSLHTINPIIGTILIDAAGLDMYTYLKGEDFDDNNSYLQTFTNDPATWKKASPVYYLKKPMPAFLVYRGGKTYPSIKETNELFMNKLLPLAPSTKYKILKGKKHVPMITQFLKTWNPRYKEITEFMKSVK